MHAGRHPGQRWLEQSKAGMQQRGCDCWQARQAWESWTWHGGEASGRCLQALKLPASPHAACSPQAAPHAVPTLSSQSAAVDREMSVQEASHSTCIAIARSRPAAAGALKRRIVPLATRRQGGAACEKVLARSSMTNQAALTSSNCEV